MGNSEKPPIKITRVPDPVPEAAPAREPAKEGAPVKISFTAAHPAAPQPKRTAPKPQIEALTALYRSGRVEEALNAARAMAREYPDTMAGWNICGAAARALGQLELAEESFRRLEALRPDFAGGPYNLGLVLEGKGDIAGAEAAYRRAVAADPSLAQARNNLGTLLAADWQLDEAIEHLEHACQLRPDLAEVHNTLGNALKKAGRLDEAHAAYKAALSVNPRFVQALYNLGVFEHDHGDLKRASTFLRQALDLDPSHTMARASLVTSLAKQCDWAGLAEYREDISGLGVVTTGVPPFPLLALEDHPANQLARSRNWSLLRRGEPAQSAWQAARRDDRPERLKIGYFSADYHDHPGMRLIAGLLREHDRSRYEIHAYSFGPAHEDEWRELARSCVDHFHEVSEWRDERIVALARSHELDIAIDRQGYTRDARTNLFRLGVAPIQINYLGFPSTMGVDFIPYKVCDARVAPPESKRHFSEKRIELPHTYMPCDDQLEIADPHSTRRDHSLPDDAFVFCCFNALYKLQPCEFAIWMRLLKQIPNSVLWLYRSNAVAEVNLRAAAGDHGVDPSRLVFAKRVPNADHLERHRHADLFLDTFCYNAHTTTADALWAGLPVLTKQGDQFAARVSSSLLSAVGLEELITRSDDEYEALAMALANDRERLAALRAKLAANRQTAPLFNTKLYTRHFEAGLEAAYSRWLAGEAPDDIVVEAQG